jgi:hypothetical protein
MQWFITGCQNVPSGQSGVSPAAHTRAGGGVAIGNGVTGRGVTTGGCVTIGGCVGVCRTPRVSSSGTTPLSRRLLTVAMFAVFAGMQDGASPVAPSSMQWFIDAIQ